MESSWRVGTGIEKRTLDDMCCTIFSVKAISFSLCPERAACGPTCESKFSHLRRDNSRTHNVASFHAIVPLVACFGVAPCEVHKQDLWKLDILFRRLLCCIVGLLGTVDLASPPPISFQEGHPCLYIYWGSTLMYETKGGLCPPKIG